MRAEGPGELHLGRQEAQGEVRVAVPGEGERDVDAEFGARVLCSESGEARFEFRHPGGAAERVEAQEGRVDRFGLHLRAVLQAGVRERLLQVRERLLVLSGVLRELREVGEGNGDTEPVPELPEALQGGQDVLASAVRVAGAQFHAEVVLAGRLEFVVLHLARDADLLVVQAHGLIGPVQSALQAITDCP